MKYQKEQNKIADFLVAEALSNYMHVKIYGTEQIEQEKYSKVLDVIITDDCVTKLQIFVTRDTPITISIMRGHYRI